MANFYQTQFRQNLFDDETLTNDYADNISTALHVKGMEQCVLAIDYTTGAAETDNDIYIFPEFSADGSTWYVDTKVNLTTGQMLDDEKFYRNATAATTKRIRVAFPIAENYVRIKFKEAGVAANYGTFSADAIISGQ